MFSFSMPHISIQDLCVKYIIVHLKDRFAAFYFYKPDLSGCIYYYYYYGMALASVRPSVCLGVCRKAYKQDTDWTVPARTVKPGTHTSNDKSTTPINFQGQGSKVKITGKTLLLKCYKNEHSFEICHWTWSSKLSCKILLRYDQPFSRK